MQPPNLDDPDTKRAYRRELRAYKRPLRLTGLGLVIAGVAMLIWAPHATGSLPATLNRVGWMAIGAGWVLGAVSIILRTRYHRARMRGDD